MNEIELMQEISMKLDIVNGYLEYIFIFIIGIVIYLVMKMLSSFLSTIFS